MYIVATFLLHLIAIIFDYLFVYYFQIGGLEDHYHFHHSHVVRRSTFATRGTHSFIHMDPKVSKTLIFHSFTLHLLPFFYTSKYSSRLIKMTGRWASTYSQLYFTVQPGILS